MKRPASADGKKLKAAKGLPGDGSDTSQQAPLALPAPKPSEEGSNALPEHGNESSPAIGAANSLPANGKGGTSQVAVKKEQVEAPKAKATGKAKALPAIPPKEASNMMKHMKRLEKKGDNQLLQQYSTCKSQQDKRAFFFYTVYQLDPRVSKKDVLKEDRDEERRKVEINDDWFTADQIAADKGILPHNPNYVNLLNACTAGLQERPHESPALAKMGVMQYKYAMVKKTTTHLQARALKLEEKVEDVATENFEEMRSALAGPAPKKLISKKEEREPEMLKDEAAPEDCELDKAQAEYQLSWRKCKAAMTAITAEISGLEVVLSQLHALPDDGTNGKMKQAYLEQSENNSAALEKTKKNAVAKFSAFPGKGKWDSLSQGDCEAKGNDLVGLTKMVLDAVKDTKKQVAPIKKWLQDADK